MTLGRPWRQILTVTDAAFHGDGGKALVDEIRPTTAFGFGKGDPFSQTRGRFAHGPA